MESENTIIGNNAHVQASDVHCRFCFDVLRSKLNGEKPPEPEFHDADALVPLFVTWKTKSFTSEDKDKDSWDLRGCIGTFSDDLTLGHGLHKYALTSALNDTRFSPITKAELRFLAVGVSVLTKFEKAKHALDWLVGTHGISITFDDPQSGRVRRATFLPEVAHEQGWDHHQTLTALIRKSGYHAPVTSSLLDKLHVVKYQSSKAWMTWREFQSNS